MIYFLSEKLRRVLNKHHSPIHFKPTNTLRHKLVHPKDKTPRHKQSNVVYAVQCSQDCTYLYTQNNNKPMAQHRRVNSSGQDLHLEEK